MSQEYLHNCLWCVAGSETKSDVAPDSIPGKFESFVDNAKDKVTGGSSDSTQRVRSTADKASNAADDTLKSVSDSVANTVNATTPQELTLSDDSALSSEDVTDATSTVQDAAPSPDTSSPSDALTSVTDGVQDAAGKAAEQMQSIVKPEAKEVTAEAASKTWSAENNNAVADAGSSAYIAADTEKPSREVPTTEVADNMTKAGDAAKDLAGQVLFASHILLKLTFRHNKQCLLMSLHCIAINIGSMQHEHVSESHSKFCSCANASEQCHVGCQQVLYSEVGLHVYHWMSLQHVPCSSHPCHCKA